MHESYSTGEGRSLRDVFLKVHRFVQRCMGLGFIVFVMIIAYLIYVKTGYDRDAYSIVYVTGGASSVEQPSSMHSVAIALQPEKVRDYVARPITNADIENLHLFFGEYQKAYEKFMRGANRIGWGEDESKVSSFRIMLMVLNSVIVTLFSYNKSPVFDKAVAELGGYEKHYDGIFSFAGVLAAIDTVALSHQIENKYSDEMIELVLEEQELVKTRYDNAIIETEDGQVDVKAVIMASGPGVIALVRMPRTSFEAWRALSVQERSRIAEEMTIFKKGDLFLGVAFEPAEIFRKVFVDEFNEQN